MLLTGDLGFTVVEPFAERFPDRFFNVGVAEQNMVGCRHGPRRSRASSPSSTRSRRSRRCGRTSSSATARFYSICPCGSSASAVGSSTGTNGVTHHALEDMAVMRVQPGLAVVAPADFEQARTALTDDQSGHGPVYFRLGKDEADTVPGLDGRFRLDGVEQHRRRPRRRHRHDRIHHASRPPRCRRLLEARGIGATPRRRGMRRARPPPTTSVTRAASCPARDHGRGALR